MFNKTLKPLSVISNFILVLTILLVVVVSVVVVIL